MRDAEFARCRPPLWGILHCYDYDELLKFESHYRASLHSDGHTFRPPNLELPIMPVLAALYNEIPLQNEPIVYQLIQLEKIADNWDFATWTIMLQKFAKHVMHESRPWSSRRQVNNFLARNLRICACHIKIFGVQIHMMIF